MYSYLHCFWTGNSFPLNVRFFVKKWAHHLSKSRSQFKIILWTTDSSQQAAIEYLNSDKMSEIQSFGYGILADIEQYTIKARMQYNTFYICSVEELIQKQERSLQWAFKLCLEHRLPTIASNIARVIIVNQYEGIYSDIDFLLPNDSVNFPLNMSVITPLFGSSSSLGFYLPYHENVLDDGLIENQALVVMQGHNGCLKTLISRMGRYCRKHPYYLKTEAQQHVEFLEHPTTKKLGSSLYMSEAYEIKLLKAYIERDYSRFLPVLHMLYHDEMHSEFVVKEDSEFFKFEYSVSQKPLLHDASRFHHYTYLSKITYESVTEEFAASLRVSFEDYCKNYWGKFVKFFDETALASQFQFKTLDGMTVAMYSWAHPGYSRLKALEDAATVIGREYRSRGGFIKKEVYIALIEKLKMWCSSESESERIKFKVSFFEKLQDRLRSLSVLSLSREDAVIHLHSLLLIVELKSWQEDQDRLKSFLCDELNRNGKFIKIKQLIDPQKEAINPNDLFAFVSG